MADQYTQLGQQAMRDTMGQAAALTGGYGTSYANLVSNQAYQQYLTALNESIPDLYDRAYQVYQDEGDELLSQYQLAASHPGYLEAISPRTYTVTTPEDEEDETEDSTAGNSSYLQALLKSGLLGNTGTTQDAATNALQAGLA